MNPLRNPNINYYKGWFFVTFQVAMNKSLFGVIADKKLILNALGEMVRENLLGLGGIFPELYIDTAMVMPNHVHVVLKIDSRDEKKDLTYFIGRFKSFTTNQYHKLVKAGECVDLGQRLWADNFYDNLVSSNQELINVRNYTLKNPERWEDDRFGAVTTFVASGTGLNKQRAIWCNRWVLKVAERIYVGTVKKGGTLDTLLSSYRG